MSKSSGVIAPRSEAEAFFKANPDVDSIEMIYTDFGGVPRGKRLRQHEVMAVYESGRMFPGSITVVDITGQDTVETGLVWEDGDADRSMKPIPGTLVRTPWGGDHAAQFLVDFYELDGTPHDLDPRHVLGGVIDRFTADGLTPVLAVELEFYLVDPRRARDGAIRPARPGYSRDTPRNVEVYGLRELDDFRPFFDALYAATDVQGLPLESAISEFAPGQFELTLRHKPDALRACDDAIMYKRLVKAIAQQHGLEATFMAKPFAEQAGSGMHIHVSVNDASGANIFASADPEGTPALRHAIGGMIGSVGDAFALFAPHANSYRRFKANSYAPVAPTWGVNNRTVSFRIPAGPPPSRHVEHRACGADANPYLAVAAVLSGMHHGMTNKIDPGTAVVGNGYDRDNSGDDKPPSNWFAAVDRFHDSALMRDYLGARFVDMFSIVKRVEQDRYFGVVPTLDYDWYLRNA
ncbi:glutamine synthetase [Sphingopyxis sp. Root214]|uniref:glutamine synthetase family protein n=1 Tax=unclassified Sphingopyxis TaxID=2614943 RepID=UPI0006F5703D|nr:MULTISPECIES: glutamine synthetase family protein [unclassified Sphingopyxis]KQZ71887.1 glutamine synthetase [Sphingopyxis sp. Root154]KRC05795.1 glutamine synthetase [Sphingopyxis sp. Root214]